ncbi:MAG: hypothetical protein ACPGWR_14630 [Ardenticatenaceae bacterium]
MISIITVAGFLAMLTVTLLAYAFLWYNNDQNTRRILTVWLIFSVTIALLPLIFDMVVETFLIKESSIEWTRILARGELLIVSVAIGSDAIGRIIGSKKASDVLRIGAAGACFALIIFSSLLFAYVSRVSTESLIIDNVLIVSLLMYFMTMMASECSVLLAERNQ